MNDITNLLGAGRIGEPDSLDGSDADEEYDIGASDEETYVDDGSTALWEGDRGSLDAKQRDALVMLIKKAFISSDDRAEWRTLTRNAGPISTSLNNLYLNLVIDTRSEVAYATPARTLDNPFKTLVRDAPNNREETLLLLYLRERFRASSAAGEAHVFSDAIAMYDYVLRFRPESATDHSGDERKVTNAIAVLVTAGLLVKTKDDGRYRIHRAIEALLPLTKLNQLLAAFGQLNAGGTDSDPDANVFDTEGQRDYRGKHAAPDTRSLDIERTDAAVAADRIDAQHDSGIDLEQELA